MSNYNTEKSVNVIVHGQKQLLDTVKSKISALGFKSDKLIAADMDKPGTPGDLCRHGLASDGCQGNNS